MRYAIIEKNKVINIIELENADDYSVSEGFMLLQSDDVNIGDDFKNGVITKKEIPIIPPTIIQQIAALAATITERRTREATLAAAKTASSRTADDVAALAWMTDINSQIATLRASL